MFHCGICLNTEDSVRKRNAWDSTQCGHIYHSHCLKRWFAAKRASALEEEGSDFEDFDEFNCPMCNRYVLEEECIRLFPVETELNDQSTQTQLDDAQQLKSADYLALHPELLKFVQRILREKYKAENETTILNVQKQKLQLAVARLVEKNLSQAVQLQVAENVITRSAALMKSSVHARMQRKKGKETTKKKPGMLQRIFRMIFPIGCKIHP